MTIAASNGHTSVALWMSPGLDFVIAGGGALLTGMAAEGKGLVVPSLAVVIFASVTGLVAAANGVYKLLVERRVTTTQTVDLTEGPGGSTSRTTTVTAPPGAAPLAPTPPPVPTLKPPAPPKGAAP